MAEKKKPAPQTASASVNSRLERTRARKDKNRQANEARYRANLEKAQLRGLEPITRPITVVKKIKKGDKVIERLETHVKPLSPAELLRRDDRLRRQAIREAEEAQEQHEAQLLQAQLLHDIEQRLITCDYEPVKR